MATSVTTSVYYSSFVLDFSPHFYLIRLRYAYVSDKIHTV